MDQFEQKVFDAVNVARHDRSISQFTSECWAVPFARRHNNLVLLQGKKAHLKFCPDRALPIYNGLHGEVDSVAEVAVAFPLHFESSPDQVAAKAVSAWMHSPHHQELILSPNYARAGVGVVKDKADVFWVTMILVRMNP